MQAAETLGVDAARITQVSINTAVETAAGISAETAKQVRKALVESIKGADEILAPKDGVEGGE